MEGFNVESLGMNRKEFFQVVNRAARRSIFAALGACVVLFVLLTVLDQNTIYVVFPGSIVLGAILYFEMKALSNYGKYDYPGMVLHFRFEPERWVCIRDQDLNTRTERTWADTPYLWETRDTLMLGMEKGGSANCTAVKRCLTEEQIKTIRAWYEGAKRK